MKTDKTKCCGCTVCVNACQQKAINLINDKKGFLSFNIDASKCIKCNLCETICPIEKSLKTLCYSQVFYGVKYKSKSQRKKSQSGAAFYCFARKIIENNGIVYGVQIVDSNVQYTRVNSINNLSFICGSKYMQANLGNTFSQIEDDLKNNLHVLFVGTPCHVDGLLMYLRFKKVNVDNLLLIDLVCHGVPSNKVTNDYLSYLKKLHNTDKITNINFRDKQFGWHSYFFTYRVNKKKFCSSNFASFFFSNLGMRDLCYSCKYKNLNRVGDITIGDFWGIEKSFKTFPDKKGVSLVILNTNKGRMFFDQCKDDFYYVEAKKEQCLQRSLIGPINRSKNVDIFWDEYYKNGFIFAMIKYCNFSSSKEKTVFSYYAYKLILKIKNNVKFILLLLPKKLLLIKFKKIFFRLLNMFNR